MGGFFGTISKSACSTDLFYGTDYNSHLGTRRGGMATYDKEVEAVKAETETACVLYDKLSLIHI